MAFRPLSRVMLRAPLLPAAAVQADGRALLGHRLAGAALALASPDLSAARARGAGEAPAIERYGRRAAFRATPHGLLAGVALGSLGRRTAVGMGEPRAHLTVSWQRLARLGRALLDDPEARAFVEVRCAPSAFRSPGNVSWLAWPDADALAEEATAEVDARLGAVLDAAKGWAPWSAVRAAALRSGGEAGEDLDEYLMVLVDEGLLHHDLAPPLVGDPPLAWMKRRLARPGASPTFLQALAALGKAERALRAGRLEAGGTLLAAAPGGDGGARGAIHGVLVFEPRATPTLSRRAIERAAAIAPVLFRLQEALSPPAAERLLDPALGDALDAITEVFGSGALDLASLASGDYGTPLATGDDGASQAAAPPAALLSLLVDRLMEAAAAGGRAEAKFGAAELEAVLAPTAVPPSFELMLAPAHEPRGAGPGTGWLLGLHAPAGASWGRFAHALGAPAAKALRELAAAEHAARPGERRLDVAFAPSPATADLCTHPPVRGATLALSTWSEGAAVTPSDLELVADGAASEPLALRARDGQPVAPSPLARVRSTTAPAGVYRLLAGWSLWRQHAPWALALGPLIDLAHVPRVSVDGFVVAPASWRVPADIEAPGVLARWRRRLHLPRFVQVGHEDELLPVDLQRPGAARELAGHARAWEIYPPIGAEVDRGGRRIEAVVAVVEEAGGEAGARAASAAAATASAGSVPPPRIQLGADGWLTFKLFGAPDRQERVLAAVVAPAIRAAREAGDVDRWFFLRYVDGPGRRDHLRVRVHEASAGGLARFSASLDAALPGAQRSGDVVTVETARYHPELARYGGSQALAAVERIFESDSELVCDLAAADLLTDDPVELVVRSFDTLATSLGLDRKTRHALAARRRDAHRDLVPDVELAAEYRRRQRPLMAALGSVAGGVGPLVAHAARLTALRNGLPESVRDAVLPALLHLAAVRLAGPDRTVEARAYTFWERALEGLTRRDGSR